jgi:hypothetical protein
LLTAPIIVRDHIIFGETVVIVIAISTDKIELGFIV